jgi:signal transduction histidine kinase/ActR/RegA family two-component response regulator/PAS domain-containing protein
MRWDSQAHKHAVFRRQERAVGQQGLSNSAFLADRGEMSERIRACDWNANDWGICDLGKALSSGSPQARQPALRAAIDLILGSTFPMFVLWGESRLLLYNDAYIPILGGRHPEGLGRPFFQVWPELRATLSPVVERALAGESLFFDNLPVIPLRHGYPEQRWLTFSASPLRDEHGKVGGAFFVCTETTAHMHAERRHSFQLELADRLRGLATPEDITATAAELLGRQLGATRTGYGEVDAEQRRIGVSQDWTDGTVSTIHGLSTELSSFGPAIIEHLRSGRTLRVPDIQADPRSAPFAPSYSAIGIRSIMVVPLIKAGRLAFILSIGAAAPRHWTDEEAQLAEDVAERTWGAMVRARAEQALARQQETEGDRLRLADRRKDEFLAMLAHELRNPLAPLSMAAQVMKLPGLDETRVRQTGEIISRQVAHMTSLVDDLLDVSRVTRGLVTLEREIFDLKNVVAGAIEQVRGQIEMRKHRLAVQMSSEPAYVQGDRTRMVQVLTNLVNNAAKYTPEGGEILLQVQIQQNEVQISVRDNGVGIEPELLPHVFELFIQGNQASDRSKGGAGMGLGLALVKSLVELQGGSVQAHSAGAGKGSEFTVRLPRLEAPLQPGEAAPASNPVLGASALRILIVDDNPDAAQILAMFLESEGHCVAVEYHAEGALDNAQREAPDVFLLDIGLPGMDGYELAQRLRALPRTAHAILIALTGYGQAEDQERSKVAGFDYHFLKPADPAKLSALLVEISRRMLPAAGQSTLPR